MAKYRSLKDIHLGNSEFALKVNDIVEFDGSKLTLASGFVVPLASPSALLAAIKLGWLVPYVEGDELRYAVAAPAPPPIHTPKFTTVQRAESVLGTINDVRGPNAPQAHQASNAANTISRIAPTGVIAVEPSVFNSGAKLTVGGKASSGFNPKAVEHETGVVSVIKPSRSFGAAKAATVQIGVDDGDAFRATQKQTQERSVANFDYAKLAEIMPDKFQAPVEESRRSSPGDGNKMLAGDHLEEILPNAASTGRPAPGMYQEGARVGKPAGDAGFSTEADGVLIGTIGASREAQQEKLAATPLDAMAAALAEVSGEEVDLSSTQGSEVDIPALLAKARLEVVAHLVPEGFTWDTAPHWKTRAKLAVDLYREKPNILMAIMAIEVRAVQQDILKLMFGEAKAPAKAVMSRVSEEVLAQEST